MSTAIDTRIRASFRHANNIVARDNVSDDVSEADLKLATDALAIVKRIVKLSDKLETAAHAYHGPQWNKGSSELKLCASMHNAQYIIERNNTDGDVTDEHLSMAKSVLSDIKSLSRMAYNLQETETVKTIANENPVATLAKQFGVSEGCAQQ